MTAPQAIISCAHGKKNQAWFPVTLDQLNKTESFLEDALATSPELMGLESRRTGIRGPFAVFRQLPLPTPSNRTIFPDLVLLSASAHVIVVEVKRSVNPELRDRAVIAQIIDYASSFTTLGQDQAVKLFGGPKPQAKTWPGLIQSLFPDEPNADELADVLFSRMQGGELNLVIACDKVPVGLPDIVEGITAQNALEFDLDLVAITPYVKDATESAEIIFVPSTRVRTKIVARTVVTVTYQQGDAQPSTSVQTTSIREIERNLHPARTGSPSRPERLNYWEAMRLYFQQNATDVTPSRVTDGASLDVSLEGSGVKLKVYTYDEPAVLGVRYKDHGNVIESLPKGAIEEIQRTVGQSFGRGKKRKGGEGPLGMELKRNVDVSDVEAWPEQQAWVVEAIRKLDAALSPHIVS